MVPFQIERKEFGQGHNLILLGITYFLNPELLLCYYLYFGWTGNDLLQRRCWHIKQKVDNP